MSATPSPFRFITPRRQPQPQEQQQQQHVPTLGSRLKFVTPVKERDNTTSIDEGVINGSDGRHPVVTTKRALFGPRAFLTSSRTSALQSVEAVDSGEEYYDDEVRDRHTGVQREEGWDAVEEPESPARKKRKIKQVGGRVAELEVIEGIEGVAQEPNGHEERGDRIEDEYSSDAKDVEEEGREWDVGREEGQREQEDADGSGIDEVVVADFIKGRGLTRSVHEDGIFVDCDHNEEIPSSPTPGGSTYTGVGTSKKLLTPIRLRSAQSHSTLPDSTTPVPSKIVRKPPRFLISTPNSSGTIAVSVSVNVSATSLNDTPAPSTPATITKPTKPVSSYFRTIRPPAHQRNPYNQPEDVPLGLSIPSDWSPSKKYRRRGAAARGSHLRGSGKSGSSGKYIEGGMAEQVLGWTLETLSSSRTGGIFGYSGSGDGEGEGEVWRRVRILRVCGEGASDIRDNMEVSTGENINLGGVVIRGEETYGASREVRRYLLVTGRGFGGNVKGLDLGKEGVELKYRNPWWDMSLGNGDDYEEQKYRVLCAWDIASMGLGSR